MLDQLLVSALRQRLRQCEALLLGLLCERSLERALLLRLQLHAVLRQSALQALPLRGQAPIQGFFQRLPVLCAVLRQRPQHGGLALLQQGPLPAGLCGQQPLEARLSRLH